MNRKICIVIAFFLACALAQDYKLVWEDNFDGNTLNRNNWQHEVDCNGGGNNELQCYTARQENLYLKDGFLHIRARPEGYQNRGYTSARINTAHTSSWKYGRFVIRARMPRGDYLWPAIWMMPKDSVYGSWAASGEIDIVETRGQTPRVVEGTLHHGSGWPNNVYTGSGARTFDIDFTQDFHIFELIWTRDQIQWLVDGRVYHTQNLVRNWYSGRGRNPYTDVRQPFDQRFYFILNLAIGGGFFGANANALTTATARNWPQPEMVVDYVRVYQTDGVPINPNPVPVPNPTPRPTPAPTPGPGTPAPNPNNGNCAGKCGGQSCCDDFKLGQVCYDRNQYDCPTDPSNGRNVLCGKGLGACAGICFDVNNYMCRDGRIQQFPAGYIPPKTSAVSQKTSAAPPPPQPSSGGNAGDSGACPGGCGGQSCCNDARMGPVCYSINTHSCSRDEKGTFQLCGKDLGSCNGACYDTSFYKCENGRLGPK